MTTIDYAALDKAATAAPWAHDNNGTFFDPSVDDQQDDPRLGVTSGNDAALIVALRNAYAEGRLVSRERVDARCVQCRGGMMTLVDVLVAAMEALLRAEREYASIMLDPAYGVEGRVAATQRKHEADTAYRAALAPFVEVGS